MSSSALAALPPPLLMGDAQRNEFSQKVLTSGIAYLGLNDGQKREVFDKIKGLASLIASKDLFRFALNRATIQMPFSRTLDLCSLADNAILFLTNKNIARLNFTLGGHYLDRIEEWLNSDFFSLNCLTALLSKLEPEESRMLCRFMDYHRDKPNQIVEALKSFQTYVMSKFGQQQLAMPAAPQQVPAAVNAAAMPVTAAPSVAVNVAAAPLQVSKGTLVVSEEGAAQEGSTRPFTLPPSPLLASAGATVDVTKTQSSNLVVGDVLMPDTESRPKPLAPPSTTLRWI